MTEVAFNLAAHLHVTQLMTLLVCTDPRKGLINSILYPPGSDALEGGGGSTPPPLGSSTPSFFLRYGPVTLIDIAVIDAVEPPVFQHLVASAEEGLRHEAQELGVSREDLLKAAVCERPYLLGWAAKVFDGPYEGKQLKDLFLKDVRTIALCLLECLLQFGPRLQGAYSPYTPAQGQQGAGGSFPFAAREMSPLVRAAKANDDVVVGMLLDHGAPVSDTDADGNTALHWVLRQVCVQDAGSEKSATLGCSHSFVVSRGLAQCSALSFPLCKLQCSALSFPLCQLQCSALPLSLSKLQCSALLVPLCYCSALPFPSAFANCSALLGGIHTLGASALFFVVACPQATTRNNRSVDIRLVERLLRSGANVLAPNRSGATPVHTAAGHGNAKALMALLEKDPAGARVMANSKETPLHYAAKVRHRLCPSVCLSQRLTRSLSPSLTLNATLTPRRQASIESIRSVVPLRETVMGIALLPMPFCSVPEACCHTDSSQPVSPCPRSRSCASTPARPASCCFCPCSPQNAFYAGALVLLRYGANVHVVNYRGETAADAADRNDDPEMKALLEAAAREPGGFTMEKYRDGTNPWGHYLETALNAGVGAQAENPPSSIGHGPGPPSSYVHAPFSASWATTLEEASKEISGASSHGGSQQGTRAGTGGSWHSDSQGRPSEHHKGYNKDKDDPLYKTRMCRTIAEGSCFFGSRCRFAHSESELRPNPYTGKVAGGATKDWVAEKEKTAAPASKPGVGAWGAGPPKATGPPKPDVVVSAPVSSKAAAGAPSATKGGIGGWGGGGEGVVAANAALASFEDEEAVAR